MAAGIVNIEAKQVRLSEEGPREAFVYPAAQVGPSRRAKADQQP